jgi:hypothetical protein
VQNGGAGRQVRRTSLPTRLAPFPKINGDINLMRSRWRMEDEEKRL